MTALARRLAAAGLDWIVPAWDAPKGVAALATTRNGGVTPGLAGSLDVGPARTDALDADRRAAVLENRRRIHAFLPAPPVYVEQVHGRDVAIVDAAGVDGARERPPVADALVTRLPRVPLAVRVADCLPVLLASADGDVVAAAHAGWRGLAGGVLEAALAAMHVPPGTVVAWLGPAIGAEAFEVGDDVRDAFVASRPEDARHFRALHAGKWLADLRGLARERLARAGVSRVGSFDACTHAQPARFHSWRRDRTAGRMAAYVWREG